MVRRLTTYKYGVIVNGKNVSEALRVVLQQASGRQRWHAEADNVALEEAAARQLFPSTDPNARYVVPRFTLKDADSRPQTTREGQHSHGR